MSRPTFERFNYALRPAKNVERKMLCEAFLKLSRLDIFSNYRYVGMGAIAFVDFALVHQRLGVNDMVSIEQFDDRKNRINFNKPYSCIKMKWGTTATHLPNFKWNKKRHIIWLDYDDHLSDQILTDLQYIASKVSSGSIIVATVTADVPPDHDPKKPELRLQSIKNRIGKNKVSADLVPGNLTGWGTAKIYRDIINQDFEKALRDRNDSVEKDKDKVKYHQLFNFNYQDGTKMLTVGGIVLNEKDAFQLNPTNFDDLSFIRRVDEPYQIKAPNLTWKEMRQLNALLPTGNLSAIKWLPAEDRNIYEQLYRYFPTFIEVEL